MTDHLLSGGLAVLTTAGLLVPVARALPRHRGTPTAGFRHGLLWAWCPTESRETPHQLDAGARRCRSCKTTTKTTDEEMAHG